MAANYNEIFSCHENKDVLCAFYLPKNPTWDYVQVETSNISWKSEPKEEYELGSKRKCNTAKWTLEVLITVNAAFRQMKGKQRAVVRIRREHATSSMTTHRFSIWLNLLAAVEFDGRQFPSSDTTLVRLHLHFSRNPYTFTHGSTL